MYDSDSESTNAGAGIKKDLPASCIIYVFKSRA